jgi:hypothetical protein
MRSLHRLQAALVLSLPLIAAGALPASAQARPVPSTLRGVPELDPGLLGGVVTLVAGGLLILRERRRG